MESGKKILMGMTLDELTATARTLGLPSFVGKQMAGWLYDKHVTAIADMANISKANRARIEEAYTVGAMMPAERLESKSGARFPATVKRWKYTKA